MEISGQVALAGALVFLAHIFAWVFSFTAIPDGLLLMLLGLAGAWLGNVSPDFFGQVGEFLLSVALVIILFQGGISLRISMLREAWSGTLRLSLVSFLLSFVGVGVLLWALTPLPWLAAFIVGAIVSGTTSAVVVPFLDNLQVQPASRALLILESAITDVLTIVLTVALLQAYQTGEVEIWRMLLRVGVSFVYATCVGVIVGLVWSLLLDRVRMIQNSMFITPAFLFLIYGGVEALGFSGPIVALAFGIVLGNIGSLNSFLSRSHRVLQMMFQPVALSKREKAFFGEIVFLLQTFFFIYVGLSIRMAGWYVMGVALSLTVVMLVLRYVAVWISVPRTTTRREAGLMAVMIPKGLAAVVLASLVVQRGVDFVLPVADIVYGVVLWSITITSILVFLLEMTPLKRVYSGMLHGFALDAPVVDAESTIVSAGSAEGEV